MDARIMSGRQVSLHTVGREEKKKRRKKKRKEIKKENFLTRGRTSSQIH